MSDWGSLKSTPELLCDKLLPSMSSVWSFKLETKFYLNTYSQYSLHPVQSDVYL